MINNRKQRMHRKTGGCVEMWPRGKRWGHLLWSTPLLSNISTSHFWRGQGYWTFADRPWRRLCCSKTNTASLSHKNPVVWEDYPQGLASVASQLCSSNTLEPSLLVFLICCPTQVFHRTLIILPFHPPSLSLPVRLYPYDKREKTRPE